MADVAGKVAIVTGAGAGIGRATARKLAAMGAKVLAVDINGPTVKETASSITSAGGVAVPFEADLSIRSATEEMVEMACREFGSLEIACNNAGVEGQVAPLHQQTDESFDHVISVNLRGLFQCMRAEIAQMIAQGGGTIVNVASVAGIIGFSGLAPYVAAKHGVAGLTRTAALDYGRQGIRVNAVCPGGIDTRMLDSVVAQISHHQKTTREVMDPLHPIGRIGRPEEVADLIAWLASDEASFMTGAIIPVDGGFVAQ